MPIADYTNTPIRELISLQNRTAVVTGGARGIGLAIAKRLAEAGANIMIVDIDMGNCLEEALVELRKIKKNTLGLQYDTRDQEAMKDAAAQAAAKFGGLHIWVNDAGIYPESPFEKLSEETWKDVTDTNINGVYNGARAAIPYLKKAGGVILNLASISGIQGDEGMAHYNTTKFAVRGLTAGLAKDLGKHNIRVVAIAPTLVDTPGVHEEVPNFRKEKKEMEKNIPLGRISVPDDIARIALVLVCDLSAYVSGTTFVVDGGNLSLG